MLIHFDEYPGLLAEIEAVAQVSGIGVAGVQFGQDAQCAAAAQNAPK